LQIKTLLQNAPRRDVDKLKALLRSKEREKQQKATEDIADAQKLVTEIEMLKVVLHLVVGRGREIISLLLLYQ
jgi:hypothetical protein